MSQKLESRESAEAKVEKVEVPAYRVVLKPWAADTASKKTAERQSDGSILLLQFAAPENLSAVAEPVSAEQLLTDSQGKPSARVLFDVIFPPPGGDMELYSPWLLPVNENDAPLVVGFDPARRSAQSSQVDFAVRSDRVVWKDYKAVVFCSSERVKEMLIGLAFFAYYVSELESIESEISKSWSTLKGHLPLTHQVDDASFAKLPEVNERTEWIYGLRARFVRVEPFLDIPPAYLPPAAKRIVQELCTTLETLARLRVLDDQLEVFEDAYELCSDRILEYSYFSREYKVELWIIVILVLEVVLMGYELWVNLHRD